MKHFLHILLVLVGLNGFTQTVDFNDYDDFLKSHVSNDGVVDFDKVLKDIDDLKKITNNFAKISPNSSWSKEEFKSFWINLYNANIIELFAENYPLKSINYITDAFNKDFVDYDGSKISLDFIQHEIIRKLDDPRVHFALYATTVSSPVLKKGAYTFKNVDKELRTATVNFLNDSSKNKIASNTSRVSKIFEWYIDDFGGVEGIRNFIKKYKGEMKDTTSIVYLEYDWNLPRKK